MTDRRQAPGHVLELQGVGRRFDTVAALANIDLAIAAGEIICLVGRSGCGKSSLLRIIAGVDTPDSGRVLLKGNEVSGPSRFIEPEARNIGFVFQDYALFPHLSVEQNVMFGLKRLPGKEAGTRARAIIEHIGIGDLAGRYPHMLSGGEQQRVALARALAPKPDILLMDEPFSNLDRGLRDRVREETLALLRGLGTTVIMVTHDPEEALSAGDKVVLMKNGEIVQTGTGYDLHDRPKTPYAAEFFCAFNKIPGVYRDGHVETAIGRFAHRLDADNGAAAMLYLRPQGLSVVEGEGNLAGRLAGRAFLGEVEQLSVRVENLAEPLRVRTTSRLPMDADAVNLAILPGSTLAFSHPGS